jgi:hypothetical protein
LQLISSYRPFVNVIDKAAALGTVRKPGGYPIVLNVAGNGFLKNKSYTYLSQHAGGNLDDMHVPSEKS